ncbi:MAG: helix-turn-helix domain-containing protein [SAR324 cluster bacterium]|nr:helix-turn-helix domain-containing protein [SAR324 cluster bacterium]
MQLETVQDIENFYQILNLSYKATTEEVRIAYEMAMQTFHENSLATYSLFSDEENDQILRRISLAYMTLKDPVSRREYDQKLFRTANEPAEVTGTQETLPSSTSIQNTNLTNDYHILAVRADQTVHTAYELPQKTVMSGNIFPRKSYKIDRPSVPVQEYPYPEKEVGTTVVQNIDKQIPIPVFKESSPKKTPEQASDQMLHANMLKREENRRNLISKNQVADETIQKFLDSVMTFDGEILKHIRELKHITLHEVSMETCIREHFLQAIEQNDFPEFKAIVYLRGYLNGYVKALQLPLEKVVSDYVKSYEEWARVKKKK